MLCMSWYLGCSDNRTPPSSARRVETLSREKEGVERLVKKGSIGGCPGVKFLRIKRVL